MDDTQARRILADRQPEFRLRDKEIALLERKGSDKLAQFTDPEHAALMAIEERAHAAGLIYSARIAHPEHHLRPQAVEYLPEGSEVFDNPLWWHKEGLTQTASGYGGKLVSRRCVRLPDGKVRRVYVTQWANAGSAWITDKGRKLFLRDTD